ncbi:MAG: Alpha beta-propellor repeat-containing integrin, partial [Ilumatobacteraceae bacterium]|nr:Alpha beta-propellor repeat-containing integrin [Ilumatobacteraceae bacterium]
APTIVLATPATGATYANGQAVTASFACSDALSGIVTSTGCAGTKANGIAVPTTTAGTFTFTVTATDIAGNVTTKSVTYTVRPANTAPVVAADWGQGARDVGFYNDTAIINGSFTDVNDSGPWTMTIDFGKGTPVVVTRATSGAFSFTSPSYGSAAGTFTAKVKVCDSANLCSTDTVTVRTKVPLSSVRPSMQCVTDSGPSTPQSTPRFTARFNWKNTQAYWVYSPVGVTNAFLPLFIDRGQPTLFKPGSNTTPVTGQFYVFGVGWYLGDTLAVIMANSPRC